MTIRSITTNFFSPEKSTPFGWENLCSPAGLQSQGTDPRRQGGLRRSTSAKCPKSPFLSPPVPKHLNTIYKGRHTSPFMSPGKASGDWPVWARKNMLSSPERNMANAKSPSSKFDKSLDLVTGTLDSLAISRDSEASEAGMPKKLFNHHRDNLNETNATSPLQGEEFIETM